MSWLNVKGHTSRLLSAAVHMIIEEPTYTYSQDMTLKHKEELVSGLPFPETI